MSWRYVSTMTIFLEKSPGVILTSAWLRRAARAVDMSGEAIPQADWTTNSFM